MSVQPMTSFKTRGENAGRSFGEAIDEMGAKADAELNQLQQRSIAHETAITNLQGHQHPELVQQIQELEARIAKLEGGGK